MLHVAVICDFACTCAKVAVCNVVVFVYAT